MVFIVHLGHLRKDPLLSGSSSIRYKKKKKSLDVSLLWTVYGEMVIFKRKKTKCEE